MRSLADIAERAPEAVEVVKKTIQTVEADFSGRELDLVLMGRVSFSWPFPDNPELVAEIASVAHKTGLTSSEYFRVVTLATDERLEIDGVGGRGISYSVQVADPNDQFPKEEAEFVEEKDPNAGVNQIELDRVSLSMGHGTLFRGLELETMEPREVLRRCQMFSAAVNEAIDQTPVE